MNFIYINIHYIIHYINIIQCIYTENSILFCQLCITNKAALIYFILIIGREFRSDNCPVVVSVIHGRQERLVWLLKCFQAAEITPLIRKLYKSVS